MRLRIAAADLARQEDPIHVRVAGLLLLRRPEQHAVGRAERLGVEGGWCVRVREEGNRRKRGTKQESTHGRPPVLVGAQL
jgi:hypothetical protein